MRSFEFLCPSSADEAVEALSEHGQDAAPIAGGQSLLLELKDRVRSPRVLVSLDQIRELRGLHNGTGIGIGATTTYRWLAANPPDPPYAALGAVVADIADRPVRTMATMGGSLCQADPRFDVPAVATLLDAELVLRSRAGTRVVPADVYFLGPRKTARQPDELLCEVRLPDRRPEFRWSYQKFRMRAMDAAMVSVGVAVQQVDGAVIDARFVVGACTDRPTRVNEVEELMMGQALGPGEIIRVSALARNCVGISERPWPYLDAQYLRHMVSVLTERALAHVAFGSANSGGH